MQTPQGTDLGAKYTPGFNAILPLLLLLLLNVAAATVTVTAATQQSTASVTTVTAVTASAATVSREFWELKAGFHMIADLIAICDHMETSL